MAGKAHAWSAAACFNAGHEILAFLLDTLSATPSVRAYDQSPVNAPAPVFRITFLPRSENLQPAAAIRQLDAAEISDIQESKVNKRERVGFLPKTWVQSLQARRARWVIIILHSCCES